MLAIASLLNKAHVIKAEHRGWRMSVGSSIFLSSTAWTSLLVFKLLLVEKTGIGMRWDGETGSFNLTALLLGVYTSLPADNSEIPLEIWLELLRCCNSEHVCTSLPGGAATSTTSKDGPGNALHAWYLGYLDKSAAMEHLVKFVFFLLCCAAYRYYFHLPTTKVASYFVSFLSLSHSNKELWGSL